MRHFRTLSMLTLLLALHGSELTAQGRSSQPPTPGVSRPETQSAGWFGLGLECTGCTSAARGGDKDGPAVITHVWPGGPADIASLKVGDTIVAVNGTTVGAAQLRATMAATPLGATLRLLVSGPHRRVTLAIKKQPELRREIDGDSLPVRYRGQYGDVTVDVLTTGAPIVTRDSSGAMIIRVEGHVIRLQRNEVTQAASRRDR